MRVVYKYEVPIDGQLHRLPYGTILHAGPRVVSEGIPVLGVGPKTDHDTALVWIEQSPVADERRMIVQIYGTGHEIDDAELRWQATWTAGPFVWHLYAKDAS